MNVTLERFSNVRQSPWHILSSDVPQNYNCAILDSFDASQSVVVVVFDAAERFEDEQAAVVGNQNHTNRPRTMNGDDAVLARVYLPYY